MNAQERPSPKQLRYLWALGFEGKAPTTKSEMSALIEFLRKRAEPVC